MDISIHAPLAGRDQFVFSGIWRGRISIHAPLAGRDCGGLQHGVRLGHFNPRAPCGARRRYQHQGRRKRGISIHAPLAGRDAKLSEQERLLDDFNPRAPCGARQQADSHGNPRGYFNPRAPCGARRVNLFDAAGSDGFQSTRPLRGATPCCQGLQHDLQISIHAPLAGRDECPINSFATLIDFNPRAPCGARPGGVLPMAGGQKYFNPRAPCGARRAGPAAFGADGLNFNPRAPCGARPALQAVMRAGLEFQSTRPLRGATLELFPVRRRLHISIHAPLAGRDPRLRLMW